MQPIAYLVKVTLPEYLASLPIPDTIGGWFSLSIKDWLALIPPTAIAAGLGYTAYRAFCPKARLPSSSKGKVNQTVLKSQSKVVDAIDVEDIADKAVFCRCWRSKNWPYCDGSHNDHNKDNDDNVGPLIIQKKK